MSVRWPNDSLYTYRWGADGNHDLIHVEVDETTGEITKKYPVPKKLEDDGNFGSEVQFGILLRLWSLDSEDGSLSDSILPLAGIVEYPDFYGSVVYCVGERDLKDHSFWIQELQLLRGSTDMGWRLRFGTEEWQPGTKYAFDRQPQSTDASVCVGTYRHETVVDGSVEHVSGTATISRKHLFTMDKLNHFSSLSVSNDGLTVTCTGGESRNLALATVGFTSGVHYWEWKVEQAEFGSVFLGVCEKSGPPGSHTSIASRLNRWSGWGFV